VHCVRKRVERDPLFDEVNRWGHLVLRCSFRHKGVSVNADDRLLETIELWNAKQREINEAQDE
jgi:hypothetical protein